jgi:hypothetical protein
MRTLGAMALLLAGGASGCAGQKGKAAAEKAVGEFHTKLDAGDFAGIYAATHPDFKKASSEKDFVAILDAVHRKLGTVRSSEQVSWRMKQFNLDTNAQLTYKTTFSDGEGIEQFNYRVDDKSAVLVGYNINSSALVIK